MSDIDLLNNAARQAAYDDLLACCGSTRWARRMEEARPFIDLTDARQRAEEIWRSLDRRDWLEAFASHPKIGERKAAGKRPAKSARWSAAEQAGVDQAASETTAALAEANRSYQEKFGYIFIVCATGKTSEEMLALCRERLDNDPEAELLIAAEEQRKITEIRLNKLVSTTE
jgi:OHCU decarboxylase